MNRLSVRLAMAFVAVTLIAVVTVAVAANWQAAGQFQQYLTRRALQDAGPLAAELAAYYDTTGSWTGVETVLAGYGAPGRGAGAGRGGPRVMLADSSGTIQYDPRSGRAGTSLTITERAAALPIQAGGVTVGYLMLGQPGPGAQALSAAEADYLRQLRGALWLAALVAGLLGAAAGLWLSRSLTLPLARVAEAARAIGRRDWSQRVPTAGTVELAAVAKAFNEMGESLQQAEVQRRNLMADVAHELRTPLSVLQGNLRALLDGVYPLELGEIATLYDETRLLNRLVDDLRELALAEAGQLRLNMQPVPVGPLVDAAMTLFAPAAEAQGVRLNTCIADPMPTVRADADRLSQVLHNLLSNALRHTAAGGRIECRVVTERSPVQGQSWVILAIADTGAGIAAEDLPRVFDRFYRGDQSRARQSGGAGLGLAIAKSQVEAMGGTIEAASTPGTGSTFSVRLAAATV